MNNQQRRKQQRRDRAFEGVPVEQRFPLSCLDPTPEEEFATYLGRLYRQSKPEQQRRLLDEDSDKARAYLWAVKALQAFAISVKLNEGEGKDKIAKPLPALLQEIEPHLPRLADLPLSYEAKRWLGNEIAGKAPTVEANRKTYSAEEQTLLDTGSLEIVFDRGPLKLHKINDHAGAKYAGRNTKWCTTKDDPKDFNWYKDQAAIFALTVRDTPDKYQFFFKVWQLADAKDKEINQYIDVLDKLHASDQLKADFTDALAVAALRDGIDHNYLPALSELGMLQTELPAGFAKLGDAVIGEPDWMLRSQLVRQFMPVLDYLGTDELSEAMQVVAKLAHDKESFIRREVAEHLPPALDAQALELIGQFAQDTDMTVRRSVAFNLDRVAACAPGQSMQLARALAGDTDRGVREGVACSLPGLFAKAEGKADAELVEIAERLAADSDVGVRQTLAKRVSWEMPKLEAGKGEQISGVIKSLAMDDNRLVREAAASAHDALNGVAKPKPGRPKYDPYAAAKSYNAL